MAFNRKLSIGLVLLVCTACSKPHYTPPQPLLPVEDTRVEVSSGPIIGGHSENGAKTWLGIPFAAAPVGDLRWRAPEPHAVWAETRSVLNHGNWCAQKAIALDGLLGVDQDRVNGSEDCLFLDIYAPSDAKPADHLPVMFWVHGGSNIWGRAEQYDGSKLAESENVIVVVVQYRLGPLGWFAHPSLNGETANFALLDLLASLEWVQENISAFGGNPEAVTLFGESAGANNILALLAMPEADGLYRAAIAQSGLPTSAPLALAQNGVEGRVGGAVPVAQRFTGKADPDADDLRKAPLEGIFEAYRSERIPTVIRDTQTLPGGLLADAVIRHQAGKNVPIIIGSNRDEAKYLLAFDPEFSRKRFGVFPVRRDVDHYEAANKYLSGIWRGLGVTQFAAVLAKSSQAPIRTYRFDWDEEGKAGLSDLSTLIGAAHTTEIPFVFGHFEEFLGRLDTYMFTKENEEARLSLSRTMMACWGSFARDPFMSEPSLCPDWPRLSSNSDSQTLVFDTKADGGVKKEVDVTTLQQWIDALKVDPVFKNADRRCELTKKISGVFTLTAPELNADLKSICKGSE